MSSVLRTLRLLPAILIISVGFSTSANAQLSLLSSGLLSSGGEESESSGLLSGLLSGVGETVEDVGDVVDDVLGLPGEILEGLGGGGGSGGTVLGQRAAIQAVRQQRAIPLDQLMAIVAQYTTAPVIDVQLILLQDTLLLYEVKTIGDGGLVVNMYFLAATGALLQL